MRATIQLCTYNRAPLLERVLDACFEQTVGDADYEVVLVDDGSTDDTPAVIERASRRATCALTVVTQSNGGLANARNAGLARASGERIIFIDDDVLPLPNFVEEHLRAASRRPADDRAWRRHRGRERRRPAPADLEHQELQRQLLLDDQRVGAARDDPRDRRLRRIVRRVRVGRHRRGPAVTREGRPRGV